MTAVLLIYPFFKPRGDRSVFRFPPLGIASIAASLQQAGHEVHLLDCTFLQREAALQKALSTPVEVVGIYCMVTMLEDCLWFARSLRERCQLLITGGPLPTCDPLPFLQDFDVVVRGEGEQTMLELLNVWHNGLSLGSVAGIAYRPPAQEEVVITEERAFTRDLDSLPFPKRQLLPNQEYIRHGKRKYGYSITTLMSTRGCPFRCEFCSNVVFGGSYRERSPENVVDEIEEALALGYDRISFADDVFTMKPSRVLGICAEIQRRGLQFHWECLGRVDSMDTPTALAMKRAGCTRIYFGIESGDDQILKLMNKHITRRQARDAVEAAHMAGLEVGAFFILFYPGETDETVLDTLHFTTTLPLDYLGLTLPYPLPGTALYDRVRERITREWHPGESVFTTHKLTFDADFSETKMLFGLYKGQMQFKMKRKLGRLAPTAVRLFEKPTDWVFRLLR
jgi:anaerobic magnesium-protoporphyrin IX monomethyl ester cyclase